MNVTLAPRLCFVKLKLPMVNIDLMPPPLPARQQRAILPSIPRACLRAVFVGSRITATNMFRLLLGKKESGRCMNRQVTLIMTTRHSIRQCFASCRTLFMSLAQRRASPLNTWPN